MKPTPDLLSVAVKSFTGMATSPKLMVNEASERGAAIIILNTVVSASIQQDPRQSVSAGTNVALEAGVSQRESRVARKNIIVAEKGAREVDPIPSLVKPQLATLVDKPPSGEQWSYEIKFDGYRMLCRLDGGRATLFTRNGHDWTDRLPALAAALAALPDESAWIDLDAVSSIRQVLRTSPRFRMRSRGARRQA
ncbi:ATP-dependent DNA ligase [Paraburkholderia sp. RL17-337-BIB-A]|uniref:ATP-dependent DNA ligase n=1 Tax=Paraburkholderia sp. RL17-337-BIB-A TaxID=3031636 RepID=UPI0038BB5002